MRHGAILSVVSALSADSVSLTFKQNLRRHGPYVKARVTSRIQAAHGPDVSALSLISNAQKRLPNQRCFVASLVRTTKQSACEEHRGSFPHQGFSQFDAPHTAFAGGAA